MILDHPGPSSSTDVKQSACWEAPQHCKYLCCIHFDLSLKLKFCFFKNFKILQVALSALRARLARILTQIPVTFALSAVWGALSAVCVFLKKNIFKNQFSQAQLVGLVYFH